MPSRILSTAVAAACAVSLAAVAVEAQPLGTFTWQLQPFCNVVTVNVTQQGAVYTMDGYDDQCGATRRAPVVGLGTANPDGTIGLGWNIVTTPGGRGLQVDARITLPSYGGSWSDSAGNQGALALGASTGGMARPLPTTIPSAISLLTGGGILARGAVDYSPVPASGVGARLMWHPGKAAFRAGSVDGQQWDDGSVGLYSTAMGANTTASGSVSTALGNASTASGLYSTAIGVVAVASGERSTAFGSFTSASGTLSTAFGSGTTASGSFSTAFGNGTSAAGSESVALGFQSAAAGAHAFSMGDQTSASGGNSVAFGAFSRATAFESIAMGLRTTAAGNGGVALGSDATAVTGSFVFGDRSTNNVVSGVVANQFLVRAAGGVNLFTNSALTSGVTLAAGGSGWSVVSDANMKEHFRAVADDDVLTALARMPVRTWSYKTQAAAVRHMGPTAQDFHAAFGLGESDLRINTIDADGVALAAVKALEARTRTLPDDARALRDQVAALMRDNDDLRARVARLEALLDKR